jgi:hypothetical protein
VAAEEMVRRHANVHYFASYEIITGARSAGRYIGEDGRTITPDGVARAMDVFFAHFTDESSDRPDLVASHAATPQVASSGSAEPGIVCDEDDFYRALAASQPP